MKSSSFTLSALAVILSFSPIASAQDGRPVGQLFGDRAFGLGGAFTAFADDPSAAYYNPAGLAFGGDKMFAGSLQVFDQETLSLDGDFAPRSDSSARASLDSVTSGLFPTAGASLSKISDKQYLSLASFTPLHRGVKYTGVVTDTNRGLTHSVTLSTDTTEKRTLFGPAYGLRVTKELGIGAAVYLSTYTLSRGSFRSKYIAENRNPNATTWSSTSQYSERYDTDIETYAVAPVLSLLYRGDNGVRFGALVSAPSTTLLGKATLSYRGFRFQNNGVVTSELDGASDAEEPTTWSGRIGFGYEQARRFAISADVHMHLANTVKTFETPDRFSSILGIDPDIPETRDLNTVINYALGIEYYLTRSIPLRVGAFTNQSANPEIPSLTSGVAYAPHLDEYGGTVSFGYYGKKGSVHVGLGAAQTDGHVVLTYPEGTNLLPSRVGASGTRYFVTLSGAVSFAKAFVKKKKSAPDAKTLSVPSGPTDTVPNGKNKNTKEPATETETETETNEPSTEPANTKETS
jgi:hypothetical protein